MRGIKLGNTRVTGKEQYYTEPDLAQNLTFKAIVNGAGLGELQVFDALWIEPAGGAGAFVEAAKLAGLRTLSWDIEPKHADVIKGDFLEQDLSKLDEDLVIIYGNPPFGRNNSLCVRFFNYSAKFENVKLIAFLVPRSWRKWSVQDKLDPNFTLIYDMDVDANYVDDSGAEIRGIGIRTCFQIWKRSTYRRESEKVEDRGYVLKVSPEEADISITVFGRGCGTVKRDFERVPNSTQMFLKADEYVIKALEKIDFSEFYNKTAYIEALSLREIQYCLNRFFDS